MRAARCPASPSTTTPALSDHGDAQTITGLLRRLDQQGTGADRQRALFASSASPPGFIHALARATLSHSM